MRAGARVRCTRRLRVQLTVRIGAAANQDPAALREPAQPPAASDAEEDLTAVEA